MTGRLTKGLGAVVASFALFAAGATAASAGTVYSNLPKSMPKNVVSEAFEATSTSEFGGQVEFAYSTVANPTVTAVLSSWACQEGSGKSCHTAMGATFAWPITLNVYSVEADGEPGEKLASVTETFNIPYRPSANNTDCTENEEHDVGYSSSCFHGKAFKISFKPDITLPRTAILSIAYNTTNYGEHPVGAAPCDQFVPSRCGYDSLNVGLEEGTGTSVGRQPLPEFAYIDSTWAAEYGAEPHGTVGTFSLANEWGGYQPLFKVTGSKK